MLENTHYFIRFLARLMDFLLVGIVLKSIQVFDHQFSASIIVWFLVYNVVAVLLSGKTLGKYLFSLSIKSITKGWRGTLKLIIREMLMLLLLPILALNVLFMSSSPLHDRISGTKVIRNER